MSKHNRVVVMGGGTGIYPVVSALKALEIDLSTVVAASDSGGSTGRIRDEFGFPPVGDLRQSLAALASDQGKQWIRNILLYRFEKGTGLKGHNLGNLLLTALQDMTGSTTEALRIAEKVFRLRGRVIPVTETPVDLQIFYADGTSEIGEHLLDKTRHPKAIDHVSLTPDCTLNPAAREALVNADTIIIGPGDYFASLLAVLVTPGIKDAFSQNSGQVLYVMNLMTRATQTHDMTALHHQQGIEEAIGQKLDYVIVNNGLIPDPVIQRYADESEYPVEDDLPKNETVIRADVIDSQVHEQSATDTAHRSLIRHSRQKLERVLQKLL